jgi:hypothetical protein
MVYHETKNYLPTIKRIKENLPKRGCVEEILCLKKNAVK